MTCFIHQSLIIIIIIIKIKIIIGTAFDLLEWDDPEPDDLGVVGLPQPLPKEKELGEEGGGGGGDAAAGAAGDPKYVYGVGTSIHFFFSFFFFFPFLLPFFLFFV